jgi:hypothetical protein
MSCVAELKAISQKIARVYWKNEGTGIANAAAAREAPMISCIVTIQKRFVRKSSMSGLQSGLSTHGR